MEDDAAGVCAAWEGGGGEGFAGGAKAGLETSLGFGRGLEGC